MSHATRKFTWSDYAYSRSLLRERCWVLALPILSRPQEPRSLVLVPCPMLCPTTIHLPHHGDTIMGLHDILAVLIKALFCSG